MNIRCPQHRLLPWLGHGECLSCGKTFRRLLVQGKDCTCGARLMPWGKLVVERLFEAIGKPSTLTGFAGRPMCAKCFESRAMEDVPTC